MRPTTQAPLRRSATVALVLVAAVCVLSAALRLPAAAAEPEITEASPQYGDVLETLPEAFHLCFTEAVKVEEAKDWRFNVILPDGTAPGLRIVFLPSGECVDVYPGAPAEPPNGIWTFEWAVHAQADDSEGSGEIKFQLGDLRPGETPLAKPDAPAPETKEDDDNNVPVGLLIGVGLGAVVVVMAVAGFIVSRRGR